jgi:peptide/nickel transport system ATP-binding protein
MCVANEADGPVPVLEVSGLRKEYLSHRGKSVIRAVDGVSFRLHQREILGLVGESGCGKTTTGKLVMKLTMPTAGRIQFEGEDCSELDRAGMALWRRRVQMIFQDPYASMNPHYRIQDVLEEPLLVHRIARGRAEREELCTRVLDRVKLSPACDYLQRFPHMLSGGQRQRVSIARTLVLQPKVIVADEPVSMIDLSTRVEILHLLRSIQRDLGLSFIYITHDISTARYFTDRIAVMYLGRIVEIGSQDEVIDHPRHPYTKALIDAVCEPEPGRVNKKRELKVIGELVAATGRQVGCRFSPRCPYRDDTCSRDPEPALSACDEPVAAGVGRMVAHEVACHRWKDLG